MEGRFVLKGDQLILDRETGLLWQRQASGDRMVWKDGFAYIDSLNQSNFEGFSDWRYPNREELETLIMKEENRHTGLYVDTLFGTQRNCWSSSEAGHHKACYADFYYGDLYIIEENYANHFIRAVRRFQG
jgi:serine/threonine-protein kinase